MNEPYNGGGADYHIGLASAQDDAKAALENFFDEEFFMQNKLPATGYQIERDDGDRVLMSLDVDNLTKAAFVVANGIRDYNDETGWGIEAWAQCDPAEFPASMTDALDIQVWTDGEGNRIPLNKVHSFQGAGHCDWQDITFLLLDEKSTDVQYVRDEPRELTDFLQQPFDTAATLPDDAVDTGWQREGRRLWLVADGDAAYLVNIDDPSDVELWPAPKREIGCL